MSPLVLLTHNYSIHVSKITSNFNVCLSSLQMESLYILDYCTNTTRVRLEEVTNRPILNALKQFPLIMKHNCCLAACFSKCIYGISPVIYINIFFSLTLPPRCSDLSWLNREGRERRLWRWTESLSNDKMTYSCTWLWNGNEALFDWARLNAWFNALVSRAAYIF